MKNFYLACKECFLERPRNFYGCFFLGPFNNSQSLTIANALRRTLLSEISGLGITSVQIQGINHEYSTILGIRESVLDLLLNLKEIVLTYESPLLPNHFIKNKLEKQSFDFPSFGYLKINGPGIVRASDLKLPSFLKCVDPDQYLATLSENGKLNIKFEISENLGILSMEPNKTKRMLMYQDVHQEKSWKDSKNLNSNSNETLKINHSKIFKLDPVFTPIKKVNYTIQPYETFPLNTNQQVICLELWTNGSIHPRKALSISLEKLNTIFSKLSKMKILNDIYKKAILRSNQDYSLVQKKTFYHIDSRKKNLAENYLEHPDAPVHMQAYTPKPFSYRDLNLMNDSTKNEEFQSKFPNKNLEMNSLEKTEKSNNLLISDFQKKILLLEKNQKNWSNESIKILNLPFRVENSFIESNILTLKDLFTCDFKKINGLGNQSLNLLQKKLFLFLTKIS